MMALAEAAVELEYILQVLTHLGHEFDHGDCGVRGQESRRGQEVPHEAEANVVSHGPIEVGTDNTGAHDLCYRTTSGQHSRHVERKVFKMRELQRAGRVCVIHVPTEMNWADIFTKSLDTATFQRHRATILNLAAKPREE